MVELELERPDALRLAFAKGLSSKELPTMQKKTLSNFEFPTSVITKNEEPVLIKHLIIERLQQKIEDKDLDKYILMFIEHGLDIMNKEIENLSDMENYLLYLLDKHTAKKR